MLCLGVLWASPGPGADLLTPAEREWLAARDGRIRYCAIPSYAPTDFVDADGAARGVTADYLALLQERLGVRFRRLECSSWQDILQRARRRELDLVGSVQQTPEREKYLRFTRPYISIPNVILTRKGAGPLPLDRMGGLLLAGVRGYATLDWIRQRYPKIRLLPTRDDPEALEAVAFGRADAAVVDLAVASYFIDRLGITNLEVAGDTGYDWQLRLGVRDDWPELVSILNKGLASLTRAERDAIRRRWVALGYAPDRWRPAVLWAVGGTLAALVSALGAVVVWNRALAARVEARTRALESELVERTRAQQAAAQVRRTLETVLEGMDAQVVVVDLESHEVLFANRRAVESFGPDLVGRRCWEAVRDEPGPCPDCTNGSLVRPDGEPGEPVLWEGRSRVTGRWYLHCDRAVRWVDGRLVRLETSTDITERRALEDRLREAQKLQAVGTLAAGVAHDFNNIVAAILGNAELALGAAAGNPRVATRLRRIVESSERARDVVAELLAFCRQEAGPAHPVDTARAVERALTLLRSAKPARVALREQVDTAAGRVLADPVRIQRIVVNLVTNAYQATAEQGGTVEVRVEGPKTAAAPPGRADGEGRWVRIAVSDTGPGMDEEVRGRVFEPYFTTREVGQGSGLGLAVVHGTVTGLGGEVAVDSAPGRGTRFTVWLPAVEGEGGDRWSDRVWRRKGRA
ncbi:MAG: hypothetical protein Kow0092_07150 [Deferrisomatales bacterium]